MIPLHGIGGRQDLPLPFSVVLVAAAAAVVVSFLVLVIGWRTPRYRQPGGRPLPRFTRVVDSGPFRWTLRLVGLAITGWAAMALMLGQDRLTNPIFGYVYVWVWVGLVPISLLFGPVWRTLNPFRTLHVLVARLAHHPPASGLGGRLALRTGVWPAVVLLFSFVWLELVAPDRATIAVLLLWLAVYTLAMIIGGLIFGVHWYDAADPFETYAVLIAKLAPWGRDPGGTIVLRNPLANLASLRPPPGAVGFVTILLGSTAFDGLSNSTAWIAWLQEGDKPGVLVATTALVGMITLVVFSYWIAVYLCGRLSRSALAQEPSTFIHTLIPIALGYVTAHYLTVFIFEAQRTLIAWSDPLGRGWDVFGTSSWSVNLTMFGFTAVIAVIQAGAVVSGHVIGIVGAHDRALEVAAPGRATLGQIPMLLVMVGYTLGGLWLLFSR